MKRSKWITAAVTAVLLFGLMLSGCGSSTREADAPSATTSVVTAPSAGVNVCLNCHTLQSSAWVLSIHANTNSIPTYAQISNSACIPCHDPLGDGKLTDYRSPAVGCESCHGGGGLHWGSGPIAFTRIAANSTGSGQFNTCTSCHQLIGPAGTQATPFHAGTAGRIINDTHFATVVYNGSSVVVNDITGYAFDYLSDNPCADCHDPHGADVSINSQWAASGHANRNKDAAWAHYNWGLSSRAACQRCHATSGLVAYASSIINSTTYTAPLSTDWRWKPEMLKCNGCHTNNKGAVRNPGGVTETYADSATYTFPDISKSNLCMLCHTGRESGGSITASTANFSNASFINSHYLAAGGTVFTTTGYKFAGRDYTNPVAYKHDQIGLTEAGTGSSGPCVGCHMSYVTEKHHFLPTAEVANVITEIKSAVCSVCHTGGSALTANLLQRETAYLANAAAALDMELQNRGYFFFNTHPYFFKATGGTGGAVKNWLTAGDTATGKNNMGAAFNFNLIEHDPGAFAHNCYYVKRLIYDSIDWLDNNALDNSVNATLSNASHAGKTWQSDAQSYILAGGGRP